MLTRIVFILFTIVFLFGPMVSKAVEVEHSKEVHIIDNADSMTYVLAKLDKQKGITRYKTIQTLANEGQIPAELTTDQMLDIIKGGARRINLIGMLIDKLPVPLTTEEVMKIVDPVKGKERYKTIELIVRNKRMPDGLSTDEIDKVLASITNAEAREMLTKLNNITEQEKSVDGKETVKNVTKEAKHVDVNETEKHVSVKADKPVIEVDSDTEPTLPVTGFWTGRYDIHNGFNLIIEGTKPDSLRAFSHFFNIRENTSVHDGLLEMQGSFDRISGTLRLRPVRWRIKSSHHRISSLQLSSMHRLMKCLFNVKL